MKYLTRAIPRHGDNPAYALIGEKDDAPERWTALGINPIQFPQSKHGDYSLLPSKIADLVRHIKRRFLGWRDVITQIAGGAPPVDAESNGIIEYAITDPALTRFFTDVAESPDWIDWLDRRDYLTALFVDRNFSEQNMKLSNWLANRFVKHHADMIFAIIRRHGGKLTPHFWNHIGWQIAKTNPEPTDPSVLTRWVAFLMNNLPTQVDGFTLILMAKACTNADVLPPLMMVYDAMTAVLNRPLTQGAEARANREIDASEIQQL